MVHNIARRPHVSGSELRECHFPVLDPTAGAAPVARLGPGRGHEPSRNITAAVVSGEYHGHEDDRGSEQRRPSDSEGTGLRHGEDPGRVRRARIEHQWNSSVAPIAFWTWRTYVPVCSARTRRRRCRRPCAVDSLRNPDYWEDSFVCRSTGNEFGPAAAEFRSAPDDWLESPS